MGQISNAGSGMGSHSRVRVRVGPKPKPNSGKGTLSCYERLPLSLQGGFEQITLPIF